MSSFKPGETVVLSQQVRRITAPNPGMMTGPGTNTYLVGNAELAVIDPGPALPEHIDAILKTASDMRAPIRWILCTHTHLDHSPGANLLRDATDAAVIGQQAQFPKGQDPSFAPDHHWQHGDFIQTDEFTLRAVHTPGHASNHLCFYLEEEQTLFTGDHIMEGSTVVIAPPDGDMLHYMNSLRDLKQLELKHLAPAHGNRIDNPLQMIEALIWHRTMRENKTLEKMQQLGPCTLATLTPSVYDEVPAFLHGLAQMSLLAHLLKLEKEQRVYQENELWRIAG